MLLLFLIVLDRPIHEASLLPTDQNAATCKSPISLDCLGKIFYERGEL